MNKLQKIKKAQQLQAAEKRIVNIAATVYYTENGFPRQKPFTSHTEENLFEQVFWFQCKNYPTMLVKSIQFGGKTVEWTNRVSTFSHYWLGKGRMSFDEFKAACFDEPEKITA